MELLRISQNPGMAAAAAVWFHDKWGIPEAAYAQSMAAADGRGVPEWYIVPGGGRILAGAGVIENDFHDRPDLAPNVCALYVEPEARGRGLAGSLLDFICRDFQARGVGTLYLLTDHTGFYERCGWEFFCLAQGNGDPRPSRLYRRVKQT